MVEYDNFEQEGPNFQFPQLTQDVLDDHHHNISETSTNAVVTTIKKIIDTMINHTKSTLTTSTTETILSEAVTENATLVTAPVETTVSVIDVVLQSNNTGIDTNNTIITEMIESNKTVDGASVAATDASLVTNAITTTVETIVTTTESLISTISDKVTQTIDAVTRPAEEENYAPEFHTHDAIEEKTIYIILGVILGVLIIITIILLIIYKKFKARNMRSGVYCVTDLNEISISSINNKNNL